MSVCDEDVRRAMELQQLVPSRSRGVYMRVKRLRSWDAAGEEDAAPSRLRIRLEKKDDVKNIVCRALGSVALSPPASLGTEQASCTLHFRLLPKVGVSAPPVHAPSNMHDGVFPAPSPRLSVERLWSLRGCTVMDCAAVERKRGLNSPSILGTEEEKVDRRTTAAEATQKWLLYVLDREAIGEEDELEEENEAATATDDEFCFDDLTITRAQEDGGVDTSEVGVGTCRVRRKRFRDTDAPEYSLLLGPCAAAGDDHPHGCEEALSLFDTLRDHGQDCLLLEEDAGCEPELYIYPDHRRDDEYDSNAADFSANEYPEELSTGSDTTGRTDSEERNGTARRRHGRYGSVWYDEGYTEASLSSGWNSSGDDY
ncbi:uncharacterized protein Tco025E_07582 [Trypanosoma conorhini]|uniref:Transcription factor Iwr1 domain-containing protein n=1 Tax=Trypanosoma conorhini TaxID=83891 RepID=A0A3R7LZN0_9TRYP|nr:uncharacterized protein Tco025E_07582 [Trypanosoma conorhini]RNF06398.1 hypothetical protein Tco025E_07582 [Trypanosoma conorhini]